MGPPRTSPSFTCAIRFTFILSILLLGVIHEDTVQAQTCSSNPCQNGGACNGDASGYICSCPSTKSGTHCESHTTCLSNPCQNGATCGADGTGYACACTSTKSGTHCESHTTCLSNPCQNGATCNADGAGYDCSCTSEKSGTHCESHTTCLSNPCQNGATCNANGAGYDCSCTSEKSGTHCESHTSCLSNPCQNGGTCSPDGAGYACSCTADRTGSHCELYVVCVSSPCINDGTCSPSEADASHYSCLCIPMKSGTNCELHTTCLSNPCQNGATCNADGAGYDCSCTSEKSGTHCESHTTCLSNPCQNGATCNANGAGYDCSCTSEKSGTHCESHTTCLSNPCQNGATCNADGAGYDCSCTSEKSGTHCESHTTCLSNPCQNGATCNANGAGYDCSCTSEKSGTHCESHTTCLSNPCQNGATCNADGAGYDCSCTSEKSGTHCESHTTCLSNPCQNGATCNANGAGYDCSCTSEKSGTHCESHTSCLSNPCQNGGTCSPDGAGYACSCTADRTGSHCESYVVCVSSPCQNDGTCSPSEANPSHYSCLCTSIKSGTNCELHTTCESNPCQNGATCVPEAGGGEGFTCTCPVGRTGALCEEYVVCVSSPCQNGGTCAQSESNADHYSCACISIKTGANCESHISCLSDPCQNDGTCLPAAGDESGYTCECAPGKTGAHCESHIVCLSDPCRDGDTCYGDTADSYLCLSPSCRYEEPGKTYMGTTEKTASGRTCQRWDAQSPRAHSDTSPGDFLVLDLSDAANYCRNPSGKAAGPWCHAADANSPAWDYCDIPGCALECSSDPCQNGATCVPLYIEGYNCTCADNYFGIHCTNPCDSDPCQMNGTCLVNQADGLSYTCGCAEGTTGVHCEYYIACLSNPCQNGATCGVEDANVNNFECTCVTGKNGTQCEHHQMCLSNPCMNDGTCIPHPDGGEPYVCVCVAGKTGTHCEYHIPCLSSPCRDGHTCHDDNWDTYICLTPDCRWTERGESYFGVLNTTTNNYTCKSWDTHVPVLSVTSFYEEAVSDAKDYCRNPGFAKSAPWCYVEDPVEGSSTWDYCDVPGCSLDCESLPCQNGGTCVPEYVEGYNCSCPSLYYGLHCTNPCDSGPCMNNATCNPNLETGLDYYCTCIEGMTGVHCEYWEVCLSDPCMNGGTCGPSDESVWKYQCECPIGKNGTQCEIHYTCLSNPCQWDGTCLEHPDGGEPYMCACIPGKTGTHCENHIPCLSNPCREGDTCWGDNWDTYICLSSWCRWSESGESYYGNLNTTMQNHTCQRWDVQTPHSHNYSSATSFFELELSDTNSYCRNPNKDSTGPWCYVNATSPTIDYCEIPGCSLDCESVPCQNGGTCVPGWVDGYNCTCLDLYYGIHCTNPCDSDPCQNGGTCNPNTETGLDYTCTCAPGKTGVHCEYHIVCLSNPCRDGDTCHGDAWDTYICLSSYCRFTAIGHSYYGTHSYTLSGKTCQRWDVQTPYSHSQAETGYFLELNVTDASNYCRNPSNGSDYGPWCYTTDPDIRWETCDIRGCSLDCDSDPCMNGGVCVPGYEVGYYCKCPDGYYEYHCEKRAVVTNTTATFSYVQSSFDISDYTSVIIQLTLFDNEGSCSETHSGVKIASSDNSEGYIADIGSSYNQNCEIGFFMSGVAVSRVVTNSCTAPMKCAEPRYFWFTWDPDKWTFVWGSGEEVGSNILATYYNERHPPSYSNLFMTGHSGSNNRWWLMGACKKHCLNCYFDGDLTSICTKCDFLYELTADNNCAAMYPEGSFFLRDRNDPSKCWNTPITSTSTDYAVIALTTTACGLYTIKPGHDGGNDTVSIQSAEFPGYTVRHTGYVMYLEKISTFRGGSNYLPTDGTWYMTNDTSDSKYWRFANKIPAFNNYYIRSESNDNMGLQELTASEQAWFYVVKPPTMITRKSVTKTDWVTGLSPYVGIAFMIKNTDTAEIALSDGVSLTNYYRILLKSDQVQFRLTSSGAEVKSKSGSYTSSAFQHYWITWRDGILRFGSGDVTFSNQLIGYQPTNPYQVNKIQLRGGTHYEIYLLGKCTRKCSGCTFDDTPAAGGLTPSCYACENRYVAKEDRSLGCFEYRYLGCYADGLGGGSDMSSEFSVVSSLTPVMCAAKCLNANYSYAATQNGDQCGCGNYFATHGSYSESKCQMNCVGDSSQKCGGPYANGIYALNPTRFSYKTDSSKTEVDSNMEVGENTTLVLYEFHGCSNAFIRLKDATNNEGLTYEVVLGQGSTQKHQHIRHGHNWPSVASQSSTEISCTLYKPFWVYWKDGVIKLGRGDRTYDDQLLSWTDSSPMTPAKLTIATNQNSGFWDLLAVCPEHCSSCFMDPNNVTLCSRCDSNYFLYNNTCLEYRKLGCYKDQNTPRDLANFMSLQHTMTPEKCGTTCYHAGYHWFGIQGGQSCRCDNRYNTHGKASDGDCGHSCTGDGSVKCGGSWRNTVWELYPSYKCYSSPCQNMATCVNDYVWENYTCSCTNEWVGIHCEYPNPCLSDPCQNGGTCEPQNDGTYVCNCVYGYIGYVCEFTNPCLSSPCLNGGTCNDNWETGHFQCSCFPQQLGYLCEIEAITGTWSKIYSTGHNKWCNCPHLGCEGAPNVTYCQNLARHEVEYGANIILYNPNTNHCCKKYCANPNDRSISDATGSIMGHEMWLWREQRDDRDFKLELMHQISGCECPGSNGAGTSIENCKHLTKEARTNVFSWRASDSYCQYRRCYDMDTKGNSNNDWRTYRLDRTDVDVYYIPFNRTTSDANRYIGYPYDSWRHHGSSVVTTDSHRQFAYLNGDQSLNCGYLKHQCFGNIDLCPEGWSMFVWLKFIQDLSSGAHQVFMYSGGYTSSSWGFSLIGHSDTLFARWVTSTKYWGWIGAPIPSYNTWHHVGVTWGPFWGIKIYMNGIMKGHDMTPSTPSSSFETASDFYIGQYNYRTETFDMPQFGIDEFLIIGREYSKRQLWEIYSTTHHGSTCDTSPCENGAVCTKNVTSLTDFCDCQENYIGQFCEFLDPCTSSPCQNGATCEPDPDTGFYNCSCTWDHIGVNCQFLNPCVSDPCMEGGTCVYDDTTGYYECLCTDIRVGLQCEFPQPCLSSPCQNYGSCMSHYLDGTFHCQCVRDSLGRLCEYDSIKENWHYISSDHHVSTCSHTHTFTTSSLDWCKNLTMGNSGDTLNYEASTGTCQVRVCNDANTRLTSGYGGWVVYRRDLKHMTTDFERIYTTSQGGHSSCPHIGDWTDMSLERCKYYARIHACNTFNWRSNECNVKRCEDTGYSMYMNGDGWDVYTLKLGEHMAYIPMNRTYSNRIYSFGFYADGTLYNGVGNGKYDDRYALSFDGVDDYAHFHYALHLCLMRLELCPYGLTWAFWVRSTGGPDEHDNIISTGGSMNEAAGVDFLAYQSRFYAYVSKNSYRYACSKEMSYDRWYHMAVTWTNDLGISMYLDGQLACTSNSPAHYTQTYDYNSLTMGRRIDNNYYSAQAIADVVFFDRWKTRWDIWDMYSSTSHYNVCTTNPCENSGNCIQNPINTLEFCDCPVGWIGLFCEVPDPCVSDPCQNGATCNHDLEKEYFNCTCTWDYIGDLCQYLDPCLSNPCMAGGTCTRFPSDGHFWCSCTENNLGLQCEVSIPVHLDVAIVMDVSHHTNDDQIAKKRSFITHLMTRFTISPHHSRVATQYMIDGCSPNSRLNTWSNRDGPTNAINSYSYHDQYRDIWCSLKVLKDDIFHPSYGDRTANRDVVLLVTSGMSEVEASRVAAEAERLRQAGILINIVAIGNNTVKNEMETIITPPASTHLFMIDNHDVLTTNEFLPERVLAAMFALPDDPCLSNPCMNGASCLRGNWTTEEAQTYTCLCSSDYFGTHCEWLKPCLSTPCQMEGTCEQEPVHGTYYCHCTYNYNISLFERIGVNCEYDNPCLSYPCQMNGSCVDQRDTGFFICDCTWDRIGVVCEYDNPCLSSPCQMNGTCTEEAYNGTYICDCTYDRVGLDCEYDNPCLSDPCQHGSSCHHQIDGTYECECTWDYIGTHCEYYDPCISQPCQHQATCWNHPENGEYTCNCTWDYIGTHCEYFDPCISNPCQAQGTCHNEPFNGTYTCECTYDKIGLWCEFDNPCLSDPCEVEGTCLYHDSDGTYHCACRSDRVGIHCEYDERDPCQAFPCLNGGSCSASEPYKYFSCACPVYATSEYCENFMCQDTNIMNFTKITQTLGTALHIMRDMPITCKGDVSGVVFNAIGAGRFFFDVWEPVNQRTYRLKRKIEVISPGPGRQEVFFDASEWIPTEENYLWGFHFKSNAIAVLRGFDSRDTSGALTGTPWDFNTMSRIINVNLKDNVLKVAAQRTFRSIDFKSYKKIPAIQPLITMDVKGCVKVKLPDTYKSEDAAWTVGLRDDVELEASIMKKCPIGNLSIEWSWYRKSLTNGDYFYNRIEAQYYKAGGAVLKMPAREFDTGLWRIKASIDTIPTSDQIFARVVPAELVGIIIGGTSRTISKGNLFSIDAAAKSADPDADGEYGLSFSWSCHEGEVMVEDFKLVTEEFNITKCISELHFIYDATAGILNVDTTNVPPGLYTFRVKVYKDVRVAFYDQMLNLVDGFVPEMEIGCLINCAARVVPTVKLSLVLKCPQCAQLDEFVYLWTIATRQGGSYVDEDLTLISASGTTGEGLVVKANAFVPGKYYRLRLTMDCATCAESYTDYSFMTNLPPEPGSCYIDPPEGESLVTEFAGICEGWISGGSSAPDIDDVPLSYKFFTLNDDNTRSLIYFGSSAAMPPMPIGLGPADKDYVRTIIVEVFDIYGSSTEYLTTVKVKPPDLTGGGGGSANSVMTGALGMISENPKQAAQVISTIGSVLNSGGSDGGLSKEEATEIRKSMINTISTMAASVEKPDDVIQMSQALGSSTANPDEVDEDAVNAASGTLLTMTGSASSMLTSKPEAAENVAGTLMNTANNVISASSAPPATVNVDTGDVNEDSELSPEEIAAAAAKEAAEGDAKRMELAAKSQGTTNTLATVGDMVGNSVLGTKAPGEDMTSLDSASGSMQLQKQKADALGGTQCGSADSAISMPANLQIGSSSRRKKREVNSNSNVNLKVNTFASNPYSWGANTAGMGGVVNMTFEDENGDVLSADDDLAFDFANPSPAAPTDVNISEVMDQTTGLVFHKVAVGMANSSIVLKLMPPEGALVFEFFVRAGHKPTPDEYDYTSLVLGNETVNAATNGVFAVVPGSSLGSTGLYYIGLRPYDPDRVDVAAVECNPDEEDCSSSSSSSSSSSRRRRSVGVGGSNSTGVNATSYTIAITTTACRAWDNDIQDWVISGEVDEAGTTLASTKCKGKPEPKRSSFGCGFISPPNSIDFSTVFAKFANLSENPAVFSLIISIVLAYFLAVPFVIRQDRKDKERWRFDELEDNEPDDTYFYKVTVETGLKKGAGTMSNVGFMLYGRFAETGKRSMTPKNRKGFSTGSTRLLIMRTYECLGKLEFLRLWHDNSGKDSAASWFVDTITFEDMKKGVKGVFICQKDLSVQSDYGKTFAAFKAAVREERAKFSYLLKRTTKMKFTDGHMWASVALIPFRSPFTRVQRLSVCIAALFLSMVTSMMFYKSDGAEETPYQITLGPIKFTINQLWIGFVSAVVAVPPTMFIVQVYRGVNKDDANRDEAELRLMMGDSYDQIVKKQKTDWLNFGFGLYDDVSVSDMSLLEDSSSDSRSSIDSEDLDNDANSVFSDWSDIVPVPIIVPDEEEEEEKKKKKKEKEESSEEEEEEEIPDIDLDALDNLGLDGLGEVPKKKKEKEKQYDSDGNTLSADSDDEEDDEEEDEEEPEDEWAESEEEEEEEPETPEERAMRENKRKKVIWGLLIAAWTLNILAILVPAFFVILYGLQFGKEKSEEWLTSYMISWAQAIFVTDPIKVVLLGVLATVIVWRHLMKAEEKGYKNDNKEFDFTLPSDNLLNAEQLAAERQKLEARAKAKAALREMIWHLILVLLCVSISFGGAGEDGHHLYDGIHDMFVHKFLTKVKSQQSYFNYLEKYFVPNYYVETDFNNNSLNWRERKFLVDRTSYRVGPARLRQLRMAKEQCPVDTVWRKCVMGYERSGHDKAPYGPMINVNLSDPFSYDNKSAWVYQTSGMTKGLIYMGKRSTYGAGGFVMEMANNRDGSLAKIKEIKKDLWVDRQTRAVILEFTVYNPNIDLFAFTSIVAEFPSTGGIQHHFSIQVLRAYSIGGLSIYLYLCKFLLVLYMLVNLGQAIHRIVKVEKKAFFKNPKNLMDIAILGLVVAGMILYIMRFVTLNSVLESCREENYKKFAEFARVAMADDFYKYVVAFLNAAVIFKLIILLKLVKRIGALARTLNHSGPALISFAMVFLVFVFAFGLALHVVFMTDLEDFASIVTTLESSFAISLGSFDADGMLGSNLIFTMIFFPMYMVLMNWVLFSILVTIIMDSHYEFKNLEMPDDDRVLGEMLTAFWGQMNAASKVSAVGNPMGA